jgi:hypothetical protein
VNLALFVGIVALLFLLTLRLAGSSAAVVAAALVALHYSPDVAVRWAGGAQELLAVLGSLAALMLYVSGRRILAAVALLFAALSKETSLVTPAIALLLDRKPGETWRETGRRVWPLAISVGIWVALYVAMPQRHAQAGTNLAPEALGPLSALFHLGTVAIGLEWRKGELGHLPRVLPPLVPLALALAAVAWICRGDPKGSPRGDRPLAAAPKAKEPGARGGRAAKRAGARGAAKSRGRAPAWTPGSRGWIVLAGILWAVLATVPVSLVAGIWSAYYYLFACCGLALALGAWLGSRPAWAALLVVTLAAIGSASARSLDEFAIARDLWSGQSHVNGFYIERANRYVAGYLASLKRAHPTLPPRSTVFYSGLVSNTAFQTADGPLLRWAYQDSSLRSHYVKFFSREKAARGRSSS